MLLGSSPPYAVGCVSVIPDSALWLATLERLIRTFAQTLIATLGLDTTDAVNVPWERGFSLAMSAASLAVRTAVTTGRTGPNGSASPSETFNAPLALTT